MKKIIISIFSVLLISVLWYIKDERVNVNIPIPNKIIIYKNGGSKTLTSNDKNFNDIIELTNKRVNKSKSRNLEEDSDYVNYLYKNKLSWKCLEFVYDANKSFQLKIKNNKVEYNYKKLFFTIKAEGGKDYGADMAYGDKEYISIISGISYDEKIMMKLLNIIDQEIK
ncbi:hypothetical protein [Clostridium aciditolerans]|uniref:Uncharacterized protein n=1 Tax=Clostridium aciditolerans TaxID=339861 RepID=A0A934HR89_9CLOT|nr:hypothetical protein [Clostridium aciditolerans]MBI6871818.1 hypothetical protein [Clostridium aciditolerans]